MQRFKDYQRSVRSKHIAYLKKNFMLFKTTIHHHGICTCVLIVRLHYGWILFVWRSLPSLRTASYSLVTVLYFELRIFCIRSKLSNFLYCLRHCLDIPSGNVGLAILSSINLVGFCQWGIRQTAEVENQMISVERVIEYAELPPEPPLESDDKHRPLPEWPSSGALSFKLLSMRYAENANRTLRNLTFHIEPQVSESSTKRLPNFV